MLRPLAGVAFIGYLAWNLTWLVQGRIPDSIWRASTGWPCPTTGGTRSLLCYARGDWVDGFLYSPFMPILAALFAVSLATLLWHRLRAEPLRLSPVLGKLWVWSLFLAWAAKFAIGKSYW